MGGHEKTYTEFSPSKGVICAISVSISMREFSSIDKGVFCRAYANSFSRLR